MTTIELIWTVTPALILVAIAFPSFKLLYLIDEIFDPAITVKVLGRQWYWTYEYSDFTNSDNELTPIQFDSYMLSEDSLELGQLRQLEVDNRLILPINTHIRLIVVSSDVIHDFACPSLGLKIDANPGRLNQTSLIISRIGTYYGTCSELCLRLDRVFNYEKELLLLKFSSNGPSVNYDVNLYELGLKYNRKEFSILPLLVAYVNYNNIINKIITKFILFDLPLTCNWNYWSFPKKLLSSLKIKDIVQQEIISLSNKNRIFWYTEIKSVIIKSIKHSKLGNRVIQMIYNIILDLWRVRVLQLNSNSSSKKLEDRVIRGQDWNQDSLNYNTKYKFNYPNFHAKCIWKIYGYGVQTRNSFRFYSQNHKPVKDIKLNNEIKDLINHGKWLTTPIRQNLINHIGKAQKQLADISKEYNMHSKQVNYLIEHYIHTLLFQVYSIELLSRNTGSKTAGVDGMELYNTNESKLLLLSKLKGFYNLKALPGKRIYIPKNNTKELRPLTIPTIQDRAIQQLFLIILDPIIDVHSDNFSFGFRKGRNQIMAIGHIQKKLQQKPSHGNIQYFDYPYIWDADIRKCFDTINHEWLLKNIPLPMKYKKIVNNWLNSGYIEFGSSNILETHKGVPQGGIISPLLMNFTLNGLENVIYKSTEEYKNTINKVFTRNKVQGQQISSPRISKTDKNFKEIIISKDIIRYADDFIVICGSPILLDIIKKNVKSFLEIRGLEIHPNKSRTLAFCLNKPFNFLGYTFVNLIQTKHIRSKYLMSRIPEFRLKGRARLYVYSSSEKYMAIKIKITDLLRTSYNNSVFELIAKLNPIIRGWVNYYSFSNCGGTLTSFRKFLFIRLKIYLMKKHKKASIIWLMKQYFLLSELKTQHGLNIEEILKFNPQVVNNKWNLYGLSFKDGKGNMYKKPKLNILLWPNTINRLVTATIFTPPLKLLNSSYYNNKEEWIKESMKLLKFHTGIKSTLFESLIKRDGNYCYLCKDELKSDSFDSNEGIHVHHIIPWSESKSHKLENLTLVHEHCHTGYHLDNLPNKNKKGKSNNNSLKLSKNRTELK